MSNFSEIIWPTGFCDIGDLTFEQVFNTKKEFVDFTINDMEKPKGMFKKWKIYCLERSKKEKIINK